MDKQSGQDHSIENETDDSNRVVKPNLVPMQLQLLPHDVLRDIVSRLSLKDVVRMSVLSCEWRRLKICHPDLVFTKYTFGSNTTTNTDLESMESMTAEFIANVDSNTTTNTNRGSMTFEKLIKFDEKMLEWHNRKFINNVDSVLHPLWSASNATTTTLDKFVVKSGLRRKHRHYIDRWVRFSTAARAKHIAFDFTSNVTCFGSSFDKYKYVFPICCLSGPNGSCIKSLDLGYACLMLPLGFCGITNLKKLTLNMVSIDGDDLQCLLLSCTLLESLNIESCSSSSSLCIRQELSWLQYLRVRDCKLETIEFNAPNLTRFEFDDLLMQTVLKQSSKLSEAIFVSNMRLCNGYDDDLDYIFTELPTALPHVHMLLLLLTANQVERFCNTRDNFISLRHLNMNLDIFFDPYDDNWAMGLVNLLELAPLLEELEVHMDHDRYCSPNPRTVTAVQGPLHHHLRNVYMSGFCDVLGLAELALYILGNAIVLERMVIDPMTGMMEDLNTEHFYSVKAGSSEEFVLPTKGALYCVEEKRLFAKKNLDREEFRSILTIL